MLVFRTYVRLFVSILVFILLLSSLSIVSYLLLFILLALPVQSVTEIVQY